MPSSEQLIQKIRERIDYDALFAEFVEMRGRAPWKSAKCVFHEDTTPSMGVNVEDGYFLCRNPECGARGDFIDFFKRMRGLTFPEAIAELARRVGLDAELERAPERAGPSQPGIIDEAIVEAHAFRLINTPAALQFLLERRGLTRDTVVRWQLGHDGQRYFIPIRDELGQTVNIRRYKPNAVNAADKMISWRSGFGTARLWPFDSITRAQSTDEPIVLFEGEMDALLALQNGFCAITPTGGAGTWRDQWNVMFSGRDVVICYDIDAAGRAGARIVAQSLHGTARRVRVVQLPITEPANGDFTDYIVGHGHGAEDFIRLMSNTPDYAPVVETPEQAAVAVQEAAALPPPEIDTIHLSEASRGEYYGKEVRFNAVVSGKTMAPYLVPETVRVQCSMPNKPMCGSCALGDAGGNMTKELDYEDNELLQMTAVPDSVVQKMIKQKVRIPQKCGYVHATVVKSANVEEAQAIPELDRASSKDAPYVTRRLFFKGHGLETNQTYRMVGVTVPTPDRQLATHLIHTAIKSQSNIDSWTMTQDVHEQLQVFRPTRRGVTGLWEKIDEIYEDLENFTRIWSRRDLMLIVDLVYHSIIRFDFQGERLVRGWCEALIIGDSRTGKSTIGMRLNDYYGAGEFISGENTSIAGLVGGLHQIGTSWALQWGRLPLNDRRLVFVDEFGNLPVEQIQRLSSMRSSGVAEITKIHTEKTQSRTRLIGISNPRSNRPLSSFSQGVLAVKELIGAPEDIARFDLVGTAASGDVSLGLVNRARPMSQPQKYSSYLCHQRVMWAWSRGPGDVVWHEGATEEVLRLATEQGQKYQYATEIPLVEPNEQRIKLARLAVAAAAMFYSSDDTGQKVIVKPEHAKFAAEFLERTYSKPSLSFTEYAAGNSRRFELRNTERVEEMILAHPPAVRMLMEQEQLTQRDLREILNISDSNTAQTAMTTLRDSGFLRRVGTSYYVKTPAAIRWLRLRISGDGTEGVLALAPSNGAHHDDLPEEPPF